MSLASIVGAVLLVAVGLFFYVLFVNRTIDQRMAQLHNARSSNFYAFPPPLRPRQTYTRKDLREILEDQSYREKRSPDDVLQGEFAWDRAASQPTLVLFRPPFQAAGHSLEKVRAQIEFEESAGNLTVKTIKRTDTDAELPQLDNIPKQIAAFLAGRLRTQNVVALSDMPVSVRHAVMAIEDAKFLEHHGVSPKAILRAFLRNLQAGRASQGGSTITQQLMKNLFFTSQKRISRKLKEAFFAFITEMRYSKEDILEAYLNEVYLGQWSTHEIHGVSEAARHYFNKSIFDLSLSESALLAAIIQAPNAHDPRRNKERVTKRRNLVLKKMLDSEFILEPEYEMAIGEPLGVVSAERNLDDVDYFLDLVMEKLPSDTRHRLESEVLTIYVTLDPLLQGTAQRVLADNIERLKKNYPAIAAKTKKGAHLQGSLIAIHPPTCSVLALQGGKNYRETQFNRILQGKRQAGSLFKPFVILSALRAETPDGRITPATVFDDSPFEWKYDKQIWKPKNYDPTFKGPVTVRQTLEESLNVPTARITQRIGVPIIVDSLRAGGITSTLPNVPSIALGSADVSPFEVAQAFTTLANLGKWCELKPFFQVFDENKNLIHESKTLAEERFPAVPAYQTIHMMKGTFTHGTAKWTKSLNLNLANFAGKTGTTNEAKDAWFVGFSPDLLVLTWVGFDEEEKVGLTGSSAALPIWIDFMKGAGIWKTETDFPIPAGLSRCNIDRFPEGSTAPQEKVQEFFREGTEPLAPCEKVDPTLSASAN